MEVENQSSFASIYKDRGLEGLLEKIELLTRENKLLNLLANFDKKYFILYKFLKDIKRFEKGIERFGTQKQALRLIKKLKINIYTYTDLSNRNFQKQKGLLIYGINHNSFIEPIILFSLLKGKNIKLILYDLFFFLGKNIQRYALPVTARKFSSDNEFSILRFLDPLYKLRNFRCLDEDKIDKQNRKSLELAIKTLGKGGIVIIFPSGRSELNPWGKGISKIILSIPEKKRASISLLPVYFSGMDAIRMLLRIFKTYKGIKQDTLRVGVYLGKEKKISEVFSLIGPKVNEKKLLKFLRKDAFSQYGIKEFPFRIYLYPQNYPLALARSFIFLSKFLFQIFPFRSIFKFLWSQA